MIYNFNYAKAIGQASQIEAVADDMRNLASGRLRGALDSINAAWDGETSKLFLRHGEETKQRITARANELTKLAERIRQVARILKEAEERARREIENLSRRC
ncbi:MAG: WXG100 family type VII secretion target [Gracilibacteraceae bacterium]|nr:WXG100 family type VII secretion target [Gracilibacteraceae bacterium]